MNLNRILLIVALGVVFALLLGWLRQRARHRREFPYVPARALFTPAERAFLPVLDAAAGPHWRVFGKVRIADLANMRRGVPSGRRMAAFNRIAAKHFDFVICRAADLRPVCVLELDDASHATRSARQRDAFKDEVCHVIGLPLLRVPAARAYAVATIRAQLHAAVAPGERAAAKASPPTLTA